MNAVSRSVTLFVPGLKQFNLREVRQMISQPESLTQLELLFSRANYTPGESNSDEETLFKLFGVPANSAESFPVGALTCFLSKGENCCGQWMMRADPVMLQPNRDHLLLMGDASLDISMDDARRLVTDINSTFDDEPWHLEAITPKQWIVRQSTPQQLNTSSLSQVTGKNIDDHLPRGENDRYWHALMNELQMFLHAHPLNQDRQIQGLPVVNSLWFWGAGVLPEPVDKDHNFVQCWSEETVSLALARFQKVPRTNLPIDARQWLSQAITPGEHLVMLEALSEEPVKNDPAAWWQSLVVFHDRWLSPLLAALKQNSISELKLVDNSGNYYRATKPLLNRWWKRVRRI